MESENNRAAIITFPTSTYAVIIICIRRYPGATEHPSVTVQHHEDIGLNLDSDSAAITGPASMAVAAGPPQSQQDVLGHDATATLRSPEVV
jgi:hypothetical protein